MMRGNGRIHFQLAPCILHLETMNVNGRFIAMREELTSGGQVSFLMGDHLGSASVTLEANGYESEMLNGEC